jgi:hypothetical protein
VVDGLAISGNKYSHAFYRPNSNLINKRDNDLTSYDPYLISRLKEKYNPTKNASNTNTEHSNVDWTNKPIQPISILKSEKNKNTNVSLNESRNANEYVDQSNVELNLANREPPSDKENELGDEEKTPDASGDELSERSSSNSDSDDDNETLDISDIENFDEHTKSAKIVEIMNRISEKEHLKLVRRMEYRQKRVPKIIDGLRATSGRKRKNLEEELKLIMRKSKFDNYLIYKYLKNLNNSMEESLENISKSVDSLYLSGDRSDLNSSSAKQLRRPSFRARSKLPKDKSSIKENKQRNKSAIGHDDFLKQQEKGYLIKESGYSSLEDSEYESKMKNAQKAYILENQKSKNFDMSFEEFRSVFDSVVEKNAPNKPKSNNKYTKVRAMSDANSFIPRVPIVQTVGVVLNNSRNPDPNNLARASRANENQRTDSYNNRANINERGNRSQSEEGQSNNLYENTGFSNNSNRNTSSVQRESDNQNQPTAFRTMYINELDLGEDYRSRYQVERDYETGENYIIDYLKRIKYIIIQNDAANMDAALGFPIGTGESPPEGVEYIEEEDMLSLNLNNFRISSDPDTNEFILSHVRNPSQRCIILPQNWRESEESPYVAEQDLNNLNLDVYLDSRTKRKYIIDDRTGRRYYIVPTLDANEQALLRAKLLRWNNLGNPSQRLEKSDTDADDDDPNRIIIDYIEENQLNDIDMKNGEIIKDEETGERYLVHSSNKKKRWIILPNDWRISPNSSYLDEDNIDTNRINVYMDKSNNFRRYVIDEKTGERSYLIKMPNNHRSIFRARWTKMNNPNLIDPDDEDPLIRRNKVKDLNSLRENINNLDKEPKGLSLKTTANTFKPSNFNRNFNYINPSNTNKVIIKQPGKPGHVVTHRASKEKPTSFKSTKPGQQGTGKAPQSAYRVQQDAARRAYLSQKIPPMGQLWLHQQLIADINRRKTLEAWRSRSADYLGPKEEDYFDPNFDWGKIRYKKDPTMDGDQLDYDKLLDVQIYGYDKYNPNKPKNHVRSYDGEYDKNMIPYLNNKYNELINSQYGHGFGGGDNGFVRGILTEHFVESNEYYPEYITRNMGALVPRKRRDLQKQVVLTPMYLKDSWIEALNQSNKMKPRIILIDDGEKILSAKRNCQVYLQCVYQNDGVLGANRAYQLMLPDPNPVEPTRPVLITPRHLYVSKRLNAYKVGEMALREAPVFVYHNNGSAFYENMAHYLSDNKAKLSPKTVRKILQFENTKEFEEYLSAKMVRDEAKRIADRSNVDLVEVNSIKRRVLKQNANIKPHPSKLYYNRGSEFNENYPNEIPKLPEAAREYEIEGVKSTFMDFTKLPQSQ